MQIKDLDTPRLVLDQHKMDANIARLRARLDQLGVRLRAHVKTCKSIDVARRMLATPQGTITVSTLKEAEQFAGHGVTDILYAVGLAPNKLARVLALRARGVDLTVVVDSVDAARAVAKARARIPALIEIDTDDHRAGVKPDDPQLLEIAKQLASGAELRGVMTHAGDSYNCRTVDAIRAMAEQERSGTVHCAERLRTAGLPAPIVSVGSTPTATFAEHLRGVTEVRAGVYVFQDLVMVGLGVCTLQDIAISVLVTVIGHQRDKGWILTDGGWMALSRDRGTAQHVVDQGYGVVCDEAGEPCGDLVMQDANQEHGILARRGGGAVDIARYPIGTRLRVLPNHACATAAQHAAYDVVRGDNEVIATWPRFGGW